MADDYASPVSNTASDPTPYIRTYAKDVARLTGNKTVPSRSGPQKEGPEAGVLLPDYDPSQRQSARGEGSSPREFPQEVISVTSADTIANLNAHAELDPVSREVQRDEILTRLRERLGKEAPRTEVATPFSPVPPAQSHPIELPTPTPAPAPRPAAPAVAFPARPVPPSPTSVPAPSAPTPQVPAAPEHAHEHPFPFFGHRGKETQATDPSPSNLHTFKSDFSDHIDQQKASTFAVLAAQSDVREARPNAPKQAIFKEKKSRLPFVLGGIALVVLGIGLIGGTYWFVVIRTQTAAPFTVASLIFADEKVEISDTGSGIMRALSALASQPSVNGNVIVAYVTTTSDGKQGIIKTAQPSGPIIKDMLSQAPDILLRNINDASTVGVIDANNVNAPFFVLDVSSYERTFAGMLGWEASIADNLALLYPAYTAAASSSNIVSPPRFVDATVANHDVRTLKDSSGRTILIYGYRDKQTLILARDEAAFSALLSRLGASESK